jgi:hypothetical protein
VRECRRAYIWGVGIPVLAIGSAIWLGGWSFVLLLVYPMQIVRIAFQGTGSAMENWLHAFFLVLGKFPEAVGQLKFMYNKLAGKTSRLIEYK